MVRRRVPQDEPVDPFEEIEPAGMIGFWICAFVIALLLLLVFFTITCDAQSVTAPMISNVAAGAGGGGDTIAVGDAQTSTAAWATSRSVTVTSVENSYDVGYALALNLSGVEPATMTWGGNAMTIVAQESGGSARAVLYRYVGCATGGTTVQASWSAAANVCLSAFQLTNVDQSTPDEDPDSASGWTNDFSLTATSRQTTDKVVLFMTGNNSTDPTDDENQTRIATLNGGSVGEQAMSWKAGAAGTVTMGYTLSASTTALRIIINVRLKP